MTGVAALYDRPPPRPPRPPRPKPRPPRSPRSGGPSGGGAWNPPPPGPQPPGPDPPPPRPPRPPPPPKGTCHRSLPSAADRPTADRSVTCTTCFTPPAVSRTGEPYAGASPSHF